MINELLKDFSYYNENKKTIWGIIIAILAV